MSDGFEPQPWFRAKAYGYGWVPASWQGWLVTVAFMVLIIATSVLFSPADHGTPQAVALVLELRRKVGVDTLTPNPFMFYALMAFEALAFILVARALSRPIKPLD
ncbi:MAG TPA: hypothetical protein VFE18_06985 [Phenylobacterium sp.]|jgi:hypothetical protein|uniref:hypothetical protein n=1 Tax=Phenylobacterium sp. TaxID=1871053 RepID=UPI002D2B2015|nr:hypothetical protein [Phenylobacterium sp.]HZZ67900.1 hypothetical protein [Phenylobacterium sp.]